MPAIEVQNLSKRFGSVLAVDDSRSYLHPDSTPTDYQGLPIRIMVWYAAQDAPGVWNGEPMGSVR